MRKLTPLKAIRTKCMDCSCYQPKEVRLCTCTQCPLYSFRFGKNPARRGIGSSTPPFLKKHQPESKEITQNEALNDHE